MNVTEPVARLAQVAPLAPAVIRADGSAVSYAGLDRLINAAATALLQHGMVAGQVAGLMVDGPDELPGIVIMLALARIGVASADMSLPSIIMQWAVTRGGTAGPAGVQTIPLERIWAALPAPGRVVDPVAPHPGGDAVCRVLGSSGTTGTVKGTPISHALITRRVQNYWLSMGPLGPATICAMALTSSPGFTNLFRVLWGGGALVLTNPQEAAAMIHRHAVTCIVIAPASLQGLVAALPQAARPQTAKPLPSLRRVEVTGSLLPPAVLAATRANLCDTVWTLYGSSEMGGVASGPVSAWGSNLRAVGYVHPGVEVQAVDEHDYPLPPGQEGALRVRSATTAAGYVGPAEASAAVFRQGWVYGGDRGAVSSAGLISLAGRTVDVINAGGRKISPTAIEDVLLSIPAVTEAAAFGVPDQMGVTQAWAAVVATTPLNGTALTALCQERLGGRAPRYILQVPALPRNANGKIRLDELARLAAQQQPK